MARQNHALHIALSQGLASVKSTGAFESVAIADSRGLAWAVEGSVPLPDQLAAIPSLIARAFADHQPLLRFYSDKRMRFEYRSDTLAFIRKGLEGTEAGPVYELDVPGAKEAADANEFIIGWDSRSLVLRHIPVNGESWCLLGITADANAGRTALAKAAPGLATLLANAGDHALARESGGGESASLQEKLVREMESFRHSVPDVLMAAVTSKDGFVVAALEGAALDADMIAPLIGHSFLAIQESTQRLSGRTESAMLRMEEGILLSRELVDDLLFAALLAPTASTGIVLSAFESAAMSLSDILSRLSVAVAAPMAEEVMA